MTGPNSDVNLIEHLTDRAHETPAEREARVTASLARARDKYACDNPDVRVIDADLLPGGDVLPGDVQGREADRAAAAWENSWMSQLDADGTRWAS